MGVEERFVREVVDRNRTLPRYRPIRILHDASEAQVAAYSARRLELPGRPARPRPDA